jgi:hypothetical protein
MANPNLELAKRLYPDDFDIAEQIDRPEFRQWLETVATPDLELVGVALGMDVDTGDARQPEDPTRRTAHGIEGFIEAWHVFLDAWQTWIYTATDFIEIDDDCMLVLLEIRGRSATHGVEIPIEAANIVTFREGKLARLELFTSHREAYAAAGLQPPD